jgi:hypothetical protein
MGKPKPSEEDGSLRPPIVAGSQALFKAPIQSSWNLRCFTMKFSLNFLESLYEVKVYKGLRKFIKV